MAVTRIPRGRRCPSCGSVIQRKRVQGRIKQLVLSCSNPKCAWRTIKVFVGKGG